MVHNEGWLSNYYEANKNSIILEGNRWVTLDKYYICLENFSFNNNDFETINKNKFKFKRKPFVKIWSFNSGQGKDIYILK